MVFGLERRDALDRTESALDDVDLLSFFNFLVRDVVDGRFFELFLDELLLVGSGDLMGTSKELVFDAEHESWLTSLNGMDMFGFCIMIREGRDGVVCGLSMTNPQSSKRASSSVSCFLLFADLRSQK